MTRSNVVLVVLVALATVALWCSALIAGIQRNKRGSGEANAWRRVLRPLAAPFLVLSAVLGWAVADRDDCETVGTTVAIVAATGALIILRALVRAARSVRARGPILAGTAGIFRPTIHVSPELSSLLGERARAALFAHERAHARHRDPARQLLAQLATDLQWPFPRAGQRLVAWRQALEIARDDEALDAGADATDLAHAIVVGARIAGRTPRDPVVAHAMGSGEALTKRVRRLLHDEAPLTRSAPRRFPWLPVAAAVACSFVVGLTAGDELIETLLSALP